MLRLLSLSLILTTTALLGAQGPAPRLLADFNTTIKLDPASQPSKRRLGDLASDSSEPDGFVLAAGAVLFAAYDEVNGRELCHRPAGGTARTDPARRWLPALHGTRPAQRARHNDDRPSRRLPAAGLAAQRSKPAGVARQPTGDRRTNGDRPSS